MSDEPDPRLRQSGELMLAVLNDAQERQKQASEAWARAFQAAFEKREEDRKESK